MDNIVPLLAKVWEWALECVVMTVRVVPHRNLEEALKSKKEFCPLAGQSCF